MDKKKKYYWPIYEQIEKEVVDLSLSIHFDDEQASVYSMQIAELIIRCVVEIESIIKDIYRDTTGDCDEKNPGSCIMWLNKEWKLRDKRVRVVAPSFYFEKSSELAPFDYEAHSEQDYYSAYNAIKHNRLKNIKRATIYILIRALAALYILINYYEGDTILLGNCPLVDRIDKTNGSKVFEFYVFPCKAEIPSIEERVDAKICVYRVEEEERFSCEITYENEANYERRSAIDFETNECMECLRNLEGASITPDEVWRRVSESTATPVDYFKNYFFEYTNAKSISSIYVNKIESFFKAVINK